jgi:MFS family permease
MKFNNANLSSLKHILRCLGYRNFRLFFIGQLISLTGTWMQYMAMSWLVYRLTNSAFALGIIGFSSQISIFFITPFAGVWADRWNRHRIVIVTQILAMLEALSLAFLVFTNTATVWHVISLSIFLSLVNSFDIPMRQSFTVDMIENKEDIGNAIALNSLMFNIARFIGPPIAGILVVFFGEAICFLLNGISYIGVIIALMLMKIVPQTKASSNNHFWENMKEGLLYTFGFPPMRFILMLMGVVSLVVMPYAVLMPVFARDVLHGNSQTLGFLMGAAGLGALVGAIYLASKKGVRGLERTIALSTFILSAGLIVLSFSSGLWPSLFLMAFIGFGIMVNTASSNTVLQTLVDDDKRGRVMSFYTMAFIGLSPFGSLLAGSLASVIGTPNTILIAGIFCILGALVFVQRMKLFNSLPRSPVTV